MSRLNVRRLTAGLLIAALLGLAAPVSASPACWSLPTTALGAGWVGQVLEWLGGLLAGEGRQEPASGQPRRDSRAKDKAPAPPTIEDDTSIVIDPNGGK
jgi:hypothetical protein